MPHNNTSFAQITFAKQSIRRLFYLGAISGTIILAGTLTYLYATSLLTEYKSKIAQLSSSLTEEKQRFMRNAVERTIQSIDHERVHIKREYADKHLSQEELDSITKERIKDLIRDTRLINAGYIWVNEIVNYDGGDNYAIRAVHPNLPETEGKWLSTNTTDIMGNRPYAVELEGVKQHGELFFEYYFKKLNSNEIAHKMSFAKLYRPYNWVVATGVYLEDLDNLIKAETNKMGMTFRSQLKLMLSISALIIILTTFAIILFEKYLLRLVADYEATIVDYTSSLERLSSTDVLTGLSNRLKLSEVFAYELRNAQRYGTSFSIFVLDLDKFKHVNDTHGHQAGDKVLIQLADILKNNTRKTDTVGRWGGEEFLVILPKTDADRARIMANNIRQLVANQTFPFGGGITCSIGVSTFRNNDTEETMIERADQALYCAKNEGRNRVK